MSTIFWLIACFVCLMVGWVIPEPQWSKNLKAKLGWRA